MRLRDLIKCNEPNDGTRTLVESILIPEVAQAFKDWSKAVAERGVLIGGLALSYYVKPRSTTDGDFLFLSAEDIPDEVPGFKRTRKGAFLHKRTHVEIEVLQPSAIGMTPELASEITATAQEQAGVKIASRAGLIASKLNRFSLQDRADIDALLKLGPVDMTKFTLTSAQSKALEQAMEDNQS